MFIGLFVQGKVVFFPGKEAFSFVRQIVFRILTADADHGIRVQVGLFDDKAGIFAEIFRPR